MFQYAWHDATSSFDGSLMYFCLAKQWEQNNNSHFLMVEGIMFGVITFFGTFFGILLFSAMTHYIMINEQNNNNLIFVYSIISDTMYIFVEILVTWYIFSVTFNDRGSTMLVWQFYSEIFYPTRHSVPYIMISANWSINNKSVANNNLIFYLFNVFQ